MMERAQDGASLDVFAETNTAFCTLLLSAHVAAFQSTSNLSMPITLAPLVLPIIMSGELEGSFSYTSEDTGLSHWVRKNPSVMFNLSTKIESCREITRASLQFALHYKALTIENEAKLRNPAPTLAPIQLKKIGFERIANNAARLGSWFGLTQSDKLIYNILGLEV
jgi:hypothetical protein